MSLRIKLLIGAWFLAHLIAKPLGLLADLARAFGRGEFGRRVDVRTGDELEQLAATLNAMAARLQETTGRLEAVFGSMVEAVLVFDTNRRWVDANPAALELLGMRREELGRPLPEYVERFQLRRADGSPVPADETATARALRGEVVPQFQFEASPAPVVADRERIAEVIRHFLDNALKYQPDGGAIDVVVRADGMEAILTVRDHGLGIPPERLPNVFEPMYEPLPPPLAPSANGR